MNDLQKEERAALVALMKLKRHEQEYASLRRSTAFEYKPSKMTFNQSFDAYPRLVMLSMSLALSGGYLLGLNLFF